MWANHITSVELMQRLGLDAVDFYLARRQLGWLGHVARMDFSRLPRRMLSCWVPHNLGRDFAQGALQEGGARTS